MENDDEAYVIEMQIRYNIIGSLELAASFKEQINYQKNVPIADVPAEVLCIWGGLAHPKLLTSMNSAIYSEGEIRAVHDFQLVFERTCKSLPNRQPVLEVLFEEPYWKNLRDAAALALKEFRFGVHSDEPLER